MVNHWAEKGRAIANFTLDSCVESPLYRLHSGVRQVPLGIATASQYPIQATPVVLGGGVAALASAMERLMSNEEERKRLSSRAVEVIERFGLEKTMTMWEQVLNNAVGAQGR